MGVDGEYVEKGWKEVVGCMKCELTFMAGHGIFEEGASAFLFLRVDCAYNRLSFLATVFSGASLFNTSSICGYSWQRSTAFNKPSPLSTNLCACPAGTYCPSNTLAASTPSTCTAGSYCAKGSTVTAPCPSGHYCPSSSSLVPCPAGVVQCGPV